MYTVHGYIESDRWVSAYVTITERLTPENILQDHGHRGAPFCGGDQGAREGPLLYVRNQSSYILTRTKLIRQNFTLTRHTFKALTKNN